MDREALEELFAPFAVVSARRMFSGHSVYFDGLCLAPRQADERGWKASTECQPNTASAEILRIASRLTSRSLFMR